MKHKDLSKMTDAELWAELRELKKDADFALVHRDDEAAYDKAQELIGEVEQEITRRDEL